MPSPEELAEMYAEPHDHRRYGYGHGLRVAMTIELGKWFASGCESIADLSCGNAQIALDIVESLAEPESVMRWYLGDFAPGYDYEGPIEETILQIPTVEVFICSETIEHLDDPDSVLRQIRKRAVKLILSTPIGETGTDNREHIWGWDQKGVRKMLADAGWTERARVDLLLPDTYDYQIVCAT
jgi:hypothetical protein